VIKINLKIIKTFENLQKSMEDFCVASSLPGAIKFQIVGFVTCAVYFLISILKVIWAQQKHSTRLVLESFLDFSISPSWAREIYFMPRKLQLQCCPTLIPSMLMLTVSMFPCFNAELCCRSRSLRESTLFGQHSHLIIPDLRSKSLSRASLSINLSLNV
jgi:hypothetical protein